MINLVNRWGQKELLDSDDIPFADIKQNMQELNTVNTILGGHAVTLAGMKAFHPTSHGALTICEIGCGGGDNLAAIAKWCSANKISTQLTGIDIKKKCIDFAKVQYPNLKATWITNDYAHVGFTEKPSIIFSSLFCHHFSETELIKMLQWMQLNSVQGFFINDLHRHPVAYYTIKWLTRIFSRSYLVKNDAPLSVARSFKRKDWEALMRKAGIGQYSIQWKWAFRYLVVCKQ